MTSNQSHSSFAMVLGIAAVAGLILGCGPRSDPGPATGSEISTEPPAGGPVAASPSSRRRLTILATNDFHGALDGRTLPKTKVEVGGAEWMAGYVARLRADAPDRTLLLDGGDIFQGTRISNRSEGTCTLELYNRLGYDAAAVGNHEFDYGPVGEKSVATEPGDDPFGALRARAAEATFPFVMSNVYLKKTGERPEWENVHPWLMLEKNGLKIGVLGFTTVSTPTTTMPPNVKDLEFRAAEKVAVELIPKLRDRGADLIVAVGHLGGRCAGSGCSEVTDEVGALLKALDPGAIAALVTGHHHTLIKTVYRGTGVVEAWAEGRAIGRVELEHDRDTGGTKVLSVGPVYTLCRGKDPAGPCSEGMDGAELAGAVTPDATLTKALVACRDLPCDPLGEVAEELTRDRYRGSTMGAVIADLMLEATREADFAITNSGGLRADLFPGPLDECQLFRVLPFDNFISVVEMTGEEIELMLRVGASGAHGILQVAGLRYGVEPCSTWKPGDDLDGDGEPDAFELNRLTEVRTLKGKKLKKKKLYKVVTNNFLVVGGDDFGIVFEEIPPERISIDYNRNIRDAVMAAVRARKTPLAPPSGKPRIAIGPGEVDPTKWPGGKCEPTPSSVK